MARAALDPLTMADRARIHDLPAGRFAVSWRGPHPALLRQSMEALEHLLHDAPLDAPGMPELVRLFDLPRDGAALLQAAGTVSAVVDDPAVLPAAAPAAPPRLAPLDPTSLAVLEQRLMGADLARFARRTIVCRLGNAGLQTAWERRRLSIPELMEAMTPGTAARAAPWLFRRLTRVLDRRMLALLGARSELRDAGPFSFDLNVDSVLSPEFMRFDAALPPGLRGRVVLNLSPADTLADPPAFLLARDFARVRGYRVLLRGVTAALLPWLALSSMELDYVQLRWSSALAVLDLTAIGVGGARWSLAGADTEAALSWGQAAGIGLFEGHAALPGEADRFARTALPTARLSRAREARTLAP